MLLFTYRLTHQLFPFEKQGTVFVCVPSERLELSLLAKLVPKTSVSTNSTMKATFASSQYVKEQIVVGTNGLEPSTS